MKKLFLLVGALVSLIAISALIGCGLQKSNVTYTVQASGLNPVLQTASFEVVATNGGATATSYQIIPHGIAPAVTLTARNYYSTNSSFVTPQVTFTHAHVDFTVITDTGNVMTGFTPTSVDTDTYFFIPRGTASGGPSAEATQASSGEGVSTTEILNNINTAAHMSEIGNRILTVNSSVSGGVYSFSLSLKTQLVLRAVVTLSGQDEYGNAVSTGFTIQIQYTNSN